MILFQKAADLAQTAMQWVDASVSGLEMPGDDRHRLGLAATDLLQEHARAILFLLCPRPGTAQLTGSALALLRPIYEALVRSWLILYCATDTEIERHSRGYDFPGNMANHVQRIEGVANLHHDGFLERVRSGFWRTLNGFTHGGMEQLSRRISSNRVGPNYSEDDKVMAILLAAEFSLIAAVVTLEIGGKMDLAREAEGVLSKFSELLEKDGAAIRITDRVGHVHKRADGQLES